MNLDGPLFAALSARNATLKQVEPMGELPRYAKAIGAIPELGEKDLVAFSAATRRVYDLVKDGEWHSATEIIEASQVREGLRRLRELRQRGHTVERRSLNGREFEYRFIP